MLASASEYLVNLSSMPATEPEMRIDNIVVSKVRIPQLDGSSMPIDSMPMKAPTSLSTD